MDGAALAVSPRHREKDEPEAAEHRVVEELCCPVPRGDEARWSSAELCGEAAAARALRRAAEGGRRQLTGGPQAAATRGGVRGARGLEWAARPAVGPDGEGRKRKGERKGVGPAGLGFGPGQAVLFVFFSFEIKPRFKFK